MSEKCRAVKVVFWPGFSACRDTVRASATDNPVAGGSATCCPCGPRGNFGVRSYTQLGERLVRRGRLTVFLHESPERCWEWLSIIDTG